MTGEMAVLKANFVFLIFFSCFLCFKTEKAPLHRTLSTKSICPDSVPQCTSNGTHNYIIHTVADGPHDSFHYVFSTVGTPSILVARTDLHSKLNIKWDDFFSTDVMNMSKSVDFTGKVHYAYALLLNRLIEYNDVNDTASLEDMSMDAENWKFHDLSTMPWQNVSAVSNYTDNEIVFSVTDSTDKLQINKGGELAFRINAYGDSDRNKYLPYLAFTPNTTQFDFILNNLTSSFPQSRFAVELTLVTQKMHHGLGVQLNSTRSIDDENSPGVFELIDWTSEGENQTSGAYLQWKPVCYMKAHRQFQVMNRAKIYDLHTSNLTVPTIRVRSVAYGYFGDDMYDDLVTSMTSTNVSFGLHNDKFYIHTNYTVWSASLGFGTPPNDSMSSMIIIIISIGLGLPAALIIFGSMGVCIKKRYNQQHASPYTSIN